MTSPDIQAFFDEPTNTVSYLVSAPGGREAVAIDPVLDFDPAGGTIRTASADEMLAAAEARGLALVMVLETHAHADHLSAGAYVRARTGAAVAIGEHIVEVQKIFAPVFGIDDLKPDGGDFDRLLADGERLQVAGLEIEVIHTPGHTPADVSYKIGDAVFVGDTLFMPDYGTARADFPGGDARQLYRSIRKLLALLPKTRLFMCHDYLPAGRETYTWETTVAEQRAANVQIAEDVSEDAFVAMREQRDAGLPAPRLLLPSIQVNVRAGRLPPPDAGGARFLRIPVKLGPGASELALS